MRGHIWLATGNAGGAGLPFGGGGWPWLGLPSGGRCYLRLGLSGAPGWSSLWGQLVVVALVAAWRFVLDGGVWVR